VTVDVAAIEGAFAEGMKADPFHDLAGLSGVGDVRDHDPGGAGLEGADVVAVATARHTHYGVEVVDAGGADLVFEADPIVGDVLGAELDGVDPVVSQNSNDASAEEFLPGR
jgi:hypothetical protein